MSFASGSRSLWCVVVVPCSNMFGVACSLLFVVCEVLLCIASCVWCLVIGRCVWRCACPSCVASGVIVACLCCLMFVGCSLVVFVV